MILVMMFSIDNYSLNTDNILFSCSFDIILLLPKWPVFNDAFPMKTSPSLPLWTVGPPCRSIQSEKSSKGAVMLHTKILRQPVSLTITPPQSAPPVTDNHTTLVCPASH